MPFIEHFLEKVTSISSPSGTFFQKCKKEKRQRSLFSKSALEMPFLIKKVVNFHFLKNTIFYVLGLSKNARRRRDRCHFFQKEAQKRKKGRNFGQKKTTFAHFLQKLPFLEDFFTLKVPRNRFFKKCSFCGTKKPISPKREHFF